jgi:hypothetical protein
MLSACAVLCSGSAFAKSGAPHTVKAEANYSDVTISWCAPQAAKELKWHDGNDYDGDYATVKDNQRVGICYAGAKFDANDLKNNVGDKVIGIAYSMYRPLVAATAIVYEDGKKVAFGTADLSKYVKNEMQTIELNDIVTIKAGKEYIFAIEYQYGSNMDFIAIKDSSTDAPGKGDLFSADGENWSATGKGDYLITAILENDVDQAPDSYDVFCDGKKLTESSITDFEASFSNQSAGTHEYSVKANYAGESLESGSVSVDCMNFSSVLPSPNFDSYSVNDFDVNLNWNAPNAGGNALTWSEGDTYSLNIGGTASTNTKVWIRNQFDASDLWAYEGTSIKSVSTKFATAGVVTGVTVWVMKDGAFVYAEAADADLVSSIQADQWVSFPLSTPVEIEAGHSYSYGLYVLHTAKEHPITVCGNSTVNVKGNSFSVSSASSTFTKSKPSWKTLRSGSMEGNWLMRADVENAKTLDAVTYTVERDGAEIAKGISEKSIKDTVEAPGTYTYSVYAVKGDQKSLADELNATVSLPAAYTAPLLTAANFDETKRIVHLEWSTDKSLSKCGSAAYYGSFAEEMTMMWGSQFSADELQAYKGMKIKSLNFAFGEAFGAFKVGVYKKDGTALSEISIADGEAEALAAYSVSLPTPVEITGNEDLIIAYSGTIPAGVNAMLFDAGPLVDGGARISLTGGSSWMNLGTISSTYGDVNIFISAIVGDDDNAAESRERALTKTKALPKSDVELEYGVEGVGEVKAKKHAAQANPTPEKFNIYHNGRLEGGTNTKDFDFYLSDYNYHTFYVTAVYENGWESPASDSYSFNNPVAYKAYAPYGLTGTTDNNTITLNWQSPDNSKVLSYLTDTSVANAVGMTSSNPTSYCVVKYPVEDAKDVAGKRITHIQFYLADAVNSLSVVCLTNDNVVFKQSVDTDKLVKGLNDVRLNEPFEIPAGLDFSYGYVAQYDTGVKPLGMENGAATAGYGDLISSSATAGYWYSLKTKFKVDHNWWITAVLADKDSEVYTQTESAKEEVARTYNVYHRNSYEEAELIAEGLTEPTYQTAHKNGYYYVTAVDANGNESSESNTVYFMSFSGVADVAADATAADVEYFNLQGIGVSKSHLTPGIYIRRQGDSATKVLVK